MVIRRILGRFRRRSGEVADRPADLMESEVGPDQGYGQDITFTGAQVLEAEPLDQTRLVLRFRVLLLVVLVAAAAVLLAGGVFGQLSGLLELWPWFLVLVGALWLLIGLVTAGATATLGGPVLVAVGLAALLDQQFVPSFAMAAAGAVLIALGAAVIVRGLTMPRI